MSEAISERQQYWLDWILNRCLASGTMSDLAVAWARGQIAGRFQSMPTLHYSFATLGDLMPPPTDADLGVLARDIGARTGGLILFHSAVTRIRNRSYSRMLALLRNMTVMLNG